jgi:Holliday junction resolvasome RuvABC endonuclease subunit
MDFEKQKRDSNSTYLDQTRILFLDPSSTCTGFAMVGINQVRKEVEILSAGPLWFGADWNEGKKLRYLFGAIRNFFFILNQGVSEVVCEEYFFPRAGKNSKITGSTIVPEMIGVVCLAAADEDPALDFKKVSAQAWRKLLDVKPDVTEHPTEKDRWGKPKKIKDYKTPVARYVNGILKVPTEFTSNITGNTRQTPDDVTDVLGMAIGVLRSRGFTTFKAQPGWDQKHLAVKELVE